MTSSRHQGNSDALLRRQAISSVFVARPRILLNNIMTIPAVTDRKIVQSSDEPPVADGEQAATK